MKASPHFLLAQKYQPLKLGNKCKTRGLATIVKMLLVHFLGFLSGAWKLPLGIVDSGAVESVLQRQGPETLRRESLNCLISPVLSLPSPKGWVLSLPFASLVLQWPEASPPVPDATASPDSVFVFVHAFEL